MPWPTPTLADRIAHRYYRLRFRWKLQCILWRYDWFDYAYLQHALAELLDVTAEMYQKRGLSTSADATAGEMYLTAHRLRACADRNFFEVACAELDIDPKWLYDRMLVDLPEEEEALFHQRLRDACTLEIALKNEYIEETYQYIGRRIQTWWD